MNLGQEILIDVSVLLELGIQVDSFQVQTILLFVEESQDDYLFVGIRLPTFQKLDAFQHKERRQIDILGFEDLQVFH